MARAILRKFSDESEVSASDLEIVVVCEKGLYQRGPINRCLALKKSSKRQFATIDASRIPLCFHVTKVQGAEPKEADVIKLVGAEIDRTAPFDSRKPTRANAPRPSLFQPTGQHVFRIKDAQNSLLLQASSHEVLCGWVKALTDAGAKINDSHYFDELLRDPKCVLKSVTRDVGQAPPCRTKR
jgi:hypothetical protein